MSLTACGEKSNLKQQSNQRSELDLELGAWIRPKWCKMKNIWCFVTVDSSVVCGSVHTSELQIGDSHHNHADPITRYLLTRYFLFALGLFLPARILLRRQYL